MARYTFYDTPDKVVCVSTFAKRKVRGVAKCSPEDKFDFKIGHKLAQLRCDKKVAKKRYDTACDKVYRAMVKLDNAKEELDEIVHYWEKSYNELNDIEAKLEEFEKFLGKKT